MPVDTNVLGTIAKASLPSIEQVFVNAPPGWVDKDLERRLYIVRRRIEKRVNDDYFYVVSLSNLVTVYKGLCMPVDLPRFYLDLADIRMQAAICVFHQRFSTNTSPRWPLAQPFRYLAHNGEINTIAGNRQWAKARSYKFATPLIPDLQEAAPFVNTTGSDSSSLDNMLDLFLAGGMDLFRAMRLLIPPAWQKHPNMDDDLRAFYDFNSMHMEPWDGPAGIVMTDGRYATCALDRNGLRPARYVITKDKFITLASEVGTWDYTRTKCWRRAGSALASCSWWIPATARCGPASRLMTTSRTVTPTSSGWINTAADWSPSSRWTTARPVAASSPTTS